MWLLLACKPDPHAPSVLTFEPAPAAPRAPAHPFEEICAGNWPADECQGDCEQSAVEQRHSSAMLDRVLLTMEFAGTPSDENIFLRSVQCDEVDCSISFTIDVHWARIVRTFSGPRTTNPSSWADQFGTGPMYPDQHWQLTQREVLEEAEACEADYNAVSDVSEVFEVDWCTPLLYDGFKYLFGSEEHFGFMWADAVSGDIQCLDDPTFNPPA